MLNLVHCTSVMHEFLFDKTLLCSKTDTISLSQVRNVRVNPAFGNDQVRQSIGQWSSVR